MSKLLLLSAIMLGNLFFVFSQNEEQFNEDSTSLQHSNAHSSLKNQELKIFSDSKLFLLMFEKEND